MHAIEYFLVNLPVTLSADGKKRDIMKALSQYENIELFESPCI